MLVCYKEVVHIVYVAVYFILIFANCFLLENFNVGQKLHAT